MLVLAVGKHLWPKKLVKHTISCISDAPQDLPNARFGVSAYALLDLTSFWQFLSCSSELFLPDLLGPLIS